MPIPYPAKLTPEYGQKLAEFYRSFPITQTFGSTLSYSAKGEAVIDLPYNSRIEHTYSMGGAVAMALMDHASFFALIPYCENVVNNVDFSFHFLEPLGKQGLKALGRVIRLGKRISIVETELFLSDGTKAAVGTSSMIQTSLPFQL